ncbi:hypothetical protein [Alsobacter soli]|uniref:hypothetical protein n=1 Tax=Alsobacter soli TaxID=2109933 RepID=UPI0011B23987|nr:hypothetical protein [Alsobacter soli]
MRAYTVGLKRVEVYEPADVRPADSVAVESEGEVFCYVGPLDACDAERCMIEAARRHLRLKMAAYPEEATWRGSRLRLWGPAGLAGAPRKSLFGRADARAAVH